jgi:hypothetical protein
MYLLRESPALSAASSNALRSAGVIRNAIKWLDRDFAGTFGLPILGTT